MSLFGVFFFFFNNRFFPNIIGSQIMFSAIATGLKFRARTSGITCLFYRGKRVMLLICRTTIDSCLRYVTFVSWWKIQKIIILLYILGKNICHLSEKPFDKENYSGKTYYPQLNWMTKIIICAFVFRPTMLLLCQFSFVDLSLPYCGKHLLLARIVQNRYSWLFLEHSLP